MFDARRVFWSAIGVVLAAAVLVVVPGVAGAGGPSLVTETFTYTGNDQTFTVPPLVTSVEVTAYGAQGGGAQGSAGGGDATSTLAGALGGRVVTTLAVTPGEELQVNVGGRGGDGTATTTATTQTGSGGIGGSNGGGAGSGAELDGGVDNRNCAVGTGGGGGASDVRLGGTTLADRVVVAGGGGGAGASSSAGIFTSTPLASAGTNAGGAGGGATGGTGASAGGSGGTQSEGGADGGVAGAGANGGAGTTVPMSIAGCVGSGAGGAGLFGGGRGTVTFPSPGSTGGGGGGSSTPIEDTTAGVRAGDGLVTITYDPAPCGTEFSDVGASHPFCYEIEWLAGEGVANGFPDGTYRPSLPVSRGAMAAFMYRLADAELTPPEEATFTDVPTTHPFFTEVEWVADVGVSEGYPDGTFRPASSVTRQAMAAFLARLAGVPDPTPPAQPSFTDVSTSHPFFAEIEWLVAEGIAEGYDDGTLFGPTNPVSRQAMAAFLQRLADGPGVGV
jgi:hypothetical protein